MAEKQLLGVVHLLPLPTSPRFTTRQAVEEHALRDAEALVTGGLDGFIVENFGDAPFHGDRVAPSTIAELCVIVDRLRRAVGSAVSVGINVLRNDALAALSIAAATGARFIRVNVHTGVAFTDQGTLEGRAAETLRLRRELDCRVEILADVAVKHALMPAGFSLSQAAKDTALRGLADGLIVTGTGTGEVTPIADLLAVRKAVPATPLFVGSGITAANVREALAIADGVIVGTWLKQAGDVSRPVSLARVKQLVSAAQG